MTKASQANSLAATNAALPEIRDIKPPVEMGSIWPWLAALALAAAAVGVWWWRRRQGKAAPASLPAPPPPVPPHLRARERLQAALAFINEPKPFCTEVANALRDYLEARFQLHAPERTTEEFLAELGSNSTLTQSQKSLLASFLAHCDLVKFARHEPEFPELKCLHESALNLVRETEPPVFPVAERNDQSDPSDQSYRTNPPQSPPL